MYSRWTSAIVAGSPKRVIMLRSFALAAASSALIPGAMESHCWQICTSLPGWIAPLTEYPYDAPAWSIERRDFLQTQETMTRVDKDGYFVLSDRPGLGFELDQQALQKYEIKQAVVW